MSFLFHLSLSFLLLISSSYSSDEGSYSQGEQLANEKGFKIPSDINKVPGYQDPSAFAKSINEKNIDQQSENASQERPEDAFLRKTYNSRSRFDLDTESDPLFTDADKVILNPEKILNVRAQTRTFPVGVSRHTCTKGYDLFERKCKWWPTPIQEGVRPEVKTVHVYVRGNSTSIYFPHIKLGNNTQGATFDPTNLLWRSNEREHSVHQGQITSQMLIESFKALYSGTDAVSGQKVHIDLTRIVSVRHLHNHGGVTYKWQSFDESWTEQIPAADHALYSEIWHGYPVFLRLEVKYLFDAPTYKLAWQNNCDEMEGQTDTGACEYSEKRCIEGPATKVINGTPVYSKCWAEEAVYQCKSKEEDTCKELAKKGCFQVGSKCLVTLEKGHCVKWQQTYECQSGKRQASLTTLNGNKPFCLDGTCLDQSWDGNGDMIEALSKLAIFKEMQKGLQAKAGIVFKGENMGCSRHLSDFKDCCKLKGWGKSLGLTNCDENADKLAIARKQGKCVRVGTYCADRVLGVCTRKKTTYCCYPSKLAKLINVQGKQQLGLSFGSAREPQCQGLTLEQISRIDFSKLDLTELFSEIFAGMKTPNTGTLSKDIQKSMANKTYTLTDKSKKITQGRQHGNF